MSPPEDECSHLDPALRPPNPCGGVNPFEKLSAWPQNAPHGQGAMSLPAGGRPLAESDQHRPLDRRVRHVLDLDPLPQRPDHGLLGAVEHQGNFIEMGVDVARHLVKPAPLMIRLPSRLRCTLIEMNPG
jgi:hypothetical protein